MTALPERPFISRDGVEWRQVRCPGCGRVTGFTIPDGLRRGVYCSSWCIWEHEERSTPGQRVSRLHRKEARTDAWYWLFQAGYKPAEIAALYGIENDFRVHKAIRSRRTDDETRAARSVGRPVKVKFSRR